MRLIPLASERTRGHNVVLGAKHVESSPDLHSCLVWCCPMPQPIPRGNSITSSVTCFTSKGTGLALMQQAAGWRSQFFLGGSAMLSASAPSDVQVPSTNFPVKYHTTPNDSVLWYNWRSSFHLYISDFLRLYFGCLFYHSNEFHSSCHRRCVLHQARDVILVSEYNLRRWVTNGKLESGSQYKGGLMHKFARTYERDHKISQVSLQAPCSVLTRGVSTCWDPSSRSQGNTSINFSNSAQGHAATCTLSHATWIKARLVAAIYSNLTYSVTQWIHVVQNKKANVIRTAQYYEQPKKLSAPSMYPYPFGIQPLSAVIKAGTSHFANPTSLYRCIPAYAARTQWGFRMLDSSCSSGVQGEVTKHSGLYRFCLSFGNCILHELLPRLGWRDLITYQGPWSIVFK